jgi:hypothetical protein
VSPKRGDAVAPPPGEGEWDIRYAETGAAKGWEELCRTARANTCQAWQIMRTNPGPGPGKPTERHHQLKGSFATGTHGGRRLPQWQIEVTAGGRIWYLLDEERHTVWIKHAGTGHPKTTD